MDTWQAPFLGLRELPHELSQFELQRFFTYTPSERTLIDERRQPILRLGLALQIGFLRMTGRTLDGLRMVPITLWQHLGRQLDVQAPDLASLRALYRRGQTLFDHQQLACRALGFAWMSEHQRRYLVTVLRDELAHSADRDRLLGFARRWLYEHRLLIVHDRPLRKMIAAAIAQFEVELNDQIRGNVTEALLTRWREQITVPHRSGVTTQSWLWAAPAKLKLIRRCDNVRFDRKRFVSGSDVRSCLCQATASFFAQVFDEQFACPDGSLIPIVAVNTPALTIAAC